MLLQVAPVPPSTASSGETKYHVEWFRLRALFPLDTHIERDYYGQDYQNFTGFNYVFMNEVSSIKVRLADFEHSFPNRM